jgi:hypothetical protein
MNKRYNFRETASLGELHAYDSEGYEVEEGTDQFDDLVYSLRELDDGYIGNEPITLIYVSGHSKMVWATTEENPTGRTQMELVVNGGGFGF